jgi:hypothetical protein
MKSMYPFFASKAKLEALAGSDTRNYVLNGKAEAQNRFDYLSTNFDLVQAVGPSVMLDKDKFIWAYNVLNTRGISWDGEDHIMPMIDNINCNQLPDDNGDIMAQHHTSVDEETHTATQTRATRTFEAGEQLYENYCSIPYTTLAHHGFVLEDSNNDCALVNDLHIDTSSLTTNETYSLLDELEKIGVNTFSPTFCIGGPSNDSLDILANFLRIQRDGSLRDGQYGIQLDVYDLIYELVQGRIHRMEVIEKRRASWYSEENMASLMNVERNMLRLVQKEKIILKDVLEKLISRGGDL